MLPVRSFQCCLHVFDSMATIWLSNLQIHVWRRLSLPFFPIIICISSRGVPHLVSFPQHLDWDAYQLLDLFMSFLYNQNFEISWMQLPYHSHMLQSHSRVPEFVALTIIQYHVT